jgi:glycine/D-amino acid oxidase-like deaminating enzyme
MYVKQNLLCPELISAIADYNDPIYAKLANDSIKEFRKPDYKGLYHESGLFVSSPATSKMTKTYANVKALGVKNKVINSAADLHSIYPDSPVLPQVNPDNFSYVNQEGGWAESGKVVKLMIQWCIDLGAKVIPGQKAKEFIERNGQIVGVKTEEGKSFESDVVVLAAGAWTEGFLRDTPLRTPDGLVTASAHSIAAIQLNEVSCGLDTGPYTAQIWICNSPTGRNTSAVPQSWFLRQGSICFQCVCSVQVLGRFLICAMVANCVFLLLSPMSSTLIHVSVSTVLA